MSKKTKQLSVDYFKTIVKPQLEKNFVWVVEINGGTYRLCLKGKTIDYYPSSGKYFNIDKDVRGTCNNWHEDLLKLF